VISPSFGISSSRIAFVPTVVPWLRKDTSSAAIVGSSRILRIPVRTPSAKSDGVEGVFVV